MSIFHKHVWKEIAKTYAKTFSEMGGRSAQSLSHDIITGKTTILWECQICHKLRKEEMDGKEIETERNPNLCQK